MDWQTYIENCVDLPAPTGTAIDTAVLDAGLVGVTTPLTFNQVNESKALAAHTHDLETYQFNIVGVGLNWTDETVEANPQAIVNDQDLPSVTDTVQATINSWGTNLYDKGTPINDTTSGAYTGQGSAYVYRQWARSYRRPEQHPRRHVPQQHDDRRDDDGVLTHHPLHHRDLLEHDRRRRLPGHPVDLQPRHRRPRMLRPAAAGERGGLHGHGGAHSPVGHADHGVPGLR